MQLFYSKEILSSHSLDKEESSHCLKVLRKNKNDIIFITNGEGFLFECKILKIQNKIVQVKIINTTKKKQNKKVELAISFPKQRSRIEWIIEKATEIGAHKITPLLCDNSERIKINMNRINKIIISSMKQSLRTYLPEISEVKKFSEFIHTAKYQKKYIAHCKKDSNKKNIKNIKAETSCILIGPEGDFSDQEIKMADNLGFESVTLAQNRLRTETAAIIACYQLIL